MEGWKRKTQPPVVLDRFHFKQDIEGYPGPQNNHLFVIDLPTLAYQEAAAPRKLATFTTDEDSYPLWSPDGRYLAFLMGGEVRLSAHQRYRLAQVSGDGGPPASPTCPSLATARWPSWLATPSGRMRCICLPAAA